MADKCVRHRVGERLAEVSVMNRVTHGDGGVMVWTGISYGQRTQLHFIDGNLNSQKYSDGIKAHCEAYFFNDQQMHTCIPSHVKSID